MEKLCKKCLCFNPLSSFSRNNAKASGLHCYCKPCHREIAKKAISKETQAFRHLRWYQTPRGRAHTLRAQAMRRVPGEIFERDWLEKKIADGVCEVTGIRFDLSSGKGGGPGQFSPSIDKIDPLGGYGAENVQVVVFAFNALKGTLSQEQAIKLLLDMADNVRAKHDL